MAVAPTKSAMAHDARFANSADQEPTEVNPAWFELTAGEATLTGLARKARQISQARVRRARYFPDSALGDAAWDIMLSLFVDAVEGCPSSTKSVGISGGVAVSSCIAILDRLEADGLVARKRDEKDRRVTLVMISPVGLLTMRDYLQKEAIFDR